MCCIATVGVGRSRSRIGLLQRAQAMVEGIAAHCDENRLQLGRCPRGPIHWPVRASCGQGPQCHVHPHRLRSHRFQPTDIPAGAWGGWLAGTQPRLGKVVKRMARTSFPTTTPSASNSPVLPQSKPSILHDRTALTRRWHPPNGNG